MWSILILMPVSLVKRWPISASFLSEAGAKLFQQRYEIYCCWPRAGGIPVARIPARPAVVVRSGGDAWHHTFLLMRGSSCRLAVATGRTPAPSTDVTGPQASLGIHEL